MDTSEPRPRHSALSAVDKKEHGTKIFNCIVDDSTLIQGAKKSTRDGFPKWVAAGQTRLFVPLYALDRVAKIKETAKGRLASDAGETLAWLDQAISDHPHFVALQGGYEQFETWAEVERFALPATMFSEDEDKVDSMTSLQVKAESLSLVNGSDHPETSLGSDDSARMSGTMASDASHGSFNSQSPTTSPHQSYSTIGQGPDPSALAPAHERLSTSGTLPVKARTGETPAELQPILNYILWRSHKATLDSAGAKESFIFLTDDVVLRKHAHRFGIRCKTLSDVRHVVAKEKRPPRSKQGSTSQVEISGNFAGAEEAENGSVEDASNEAGSVNAQEAPKPLSQSGMMQAALTRLKEAADEDVILWKRGAVQNTASSPGPDLIDPDDFQRNIDGAHRTTGPKFTEMTPVRPTSLGGNADRSPSHKGGDAYSARPTSSRGRAGFQPRARGRGAQQHSSVVQHAEPIDPDSFARPTSLRGNAGRGKGLWTPG